VITETRDEALQVRSDGFIDQMSIGIEDLRGAWHDQAPAEPEGRQGFVQKPAISLLSYHF
jgi:hypothetical protein